MPQIQKIDRSLVVVFDLEGYPKKPPGTQAKQVELTDYHTYISILG